MIITEIFFYKTSDALKFNIHACQYILILLSKGLCCKLLSSLKKNLLSCYLLPWLIVANSYVFLIIPKLFVHHYSPHQSNHKMKIYLNIFKIIWMKRLIVCSLWWNFIFRKFSILFDHFQPWTISINRCYNIYRKTKHKNETS
jgi:hypothetical protein